MEYNVKFAMRFELDGLNTETLKVKVVTPNREHLYDNLAEASKFIDLINIRRSAMFDRTGLNREACIRFEIREEIWEVTDPHQLQQARFIGDFSYALKGNGREERVIDLTKFNIHQIQNALNAFGYSVEKGDRHQFIFDKMNPREIVLVICECLFELDVKEDQDLLQEGTERSILNAKITMAMLARGKKATSKLQLENLDFARLIIDEVAGRVMVENEHGSTFALSELSEHEILIFLRALNQELI
jgi:hypothetical protein